MRKILNTIAFLILAAVGAIYFMFGPNVFFGGPSKNTIIDVARSVMVSTAPTPEAAALAKTAQITPTGICGSSNDGGYGCSVEITIAGAQPKVMIATLKKTAEGWVATQ